MLTEQEKRRCIAEKRRWLSEQWDAYKAAKGRAESLAYLVDVANEALAVRERLASFQAGDPSEKAVYLVAEAVTRLSYALKDMAFVARYEREKAVTDNLSGGLEANA
jgi:hypothetical protein